MTQHGLDIVTGAPRSYVYACIGGNAPPQPRPRATLIPIGSGRFRAQIYSAPRDHPVTAWKKKARERLILLRDAYGFAGPIVDPGLPLEVIILSVRELPKSHHRKRQPVVRRWDTSANAGDWDNVAKPVCDAANGVLWHDDCEIARASVEQIVGAQDEAPRLEIIARPLRDIPERTRFQSELDLIQLP